MKREFKEGLLSFCSLGYNHANFLQSHIKSIWNNDYKDIEIIVVDDGSSDDSLLKLESLKAQSPCPMKIIAQENTANIGANFNTAFKEAMGEFVMFISLDDFLVENSLAMKLKIMSKNKKIAFVANTCINHVDDNDNFIKLHSLPLASMNSPQAIDLFSLEYTKFHSFYIQGTIFRSDIVEAVQGFDEDMTGDDIILRTKIFMYIVKNSEYIFRLFKDASCNYRQHANNIYGNSLRQLKTVTEYLERYHKERIDPEILFTWLSIMNLDKASYEKLFTFNSRASRLRFDPRVVKLMEK